MFIVFDEKLIRLEAIVAYQLREETFTQLKGWFKKEEKTSYSIEVYTGPDLEDYFYETFESASEADFRYHELQRHLIDFLKFDDLHLRKEAIMGYRLEEETIYLMMKNGNEEDYSEVFDEIQEAETRFEKIKQEFPNFVLFDEIYLRTDAVKAYGLSEDEDGYMIELFAITHPDEVLSETFEDEFQAKARLNELHRLLS